MKTSPSASDIPNYCNLPQGGMDATIDYKRKANSLSAAISHGDNVYYNREAIDLQVRMNVKNRHHSDSDSDDDFVDVNRLRDDAISNTYYNLRDNPMLLRSKTKRGSDPDRPVYENFTPKFKSDSPRYTIPLLHVLLLKLNLPIACMWLYLHVMVCYICVVYLIGPQNDTVIQMNIIIVI